MGYKNRMTVRYQIKRQFFFILTLLLSVAIITATSQAQRATEATDPCLMVPLVLEQTADLRKLPAKAAVPCKKSNKEQVRSYILSQIKEKLKPNQMKHEEIFLKAIGFFPDALNYEKTLIDLFLSQIGGYYDPDRKHFVMASWIPALYQSSIVIHELTHALQDQHFNLSKIIQHKKHSSDLQMARAALIEGDASALMLDFAMQQAKQKNLASMTDEEVQKYSAEMVDSLKQVTSGEHGGLDYLLVFPYSEGLKFAHQLLKNGGYEQVNASFKSKLPRSTEEILHFKKYQQSEPDFKKFEDQQLLLESEHKDYQVIYSDTFGEFFIKAWLLALALPESNAARAAAGWGGDRMILIEHAETKKRKIIWKLAWDTARDADQFFGVASPALLKISENHPNRNLQLQRKELEIFLIADF